MGRKIGPFCLCVLFAISVIPPGIFAASFDCSKATSAVEKIICGDDELSRLDESLNKAYLKALKRTDTKEQTIESQRQWLKNERNACRDAECIKKAYETRIKEVLDAISVGADRYVLVMSKDDCVCQNMLKIYNGDLNKYGEIKYDQHEEFNAIKWGKQESYFEVILSDKTVLKKHDTLISRFDINNDGAPEIIIKDQHRTLRSVDSDVLYIFRETDFDDFKDKIIINRDFGKKAIGEWGAGIFDREPFRGNVYSLYEIPAFEVWTRPTMPGKQIRNYYSLGGWFYFYPFVYQGRYFTSMHDWLPETGKEWDTEYENDGQNWEVILQFTPENKLRDICYFLKIANCKNRNR